MGSMEVNPFVLPTDLPEEPLAGRPSTEPPCIAMELDARKDAIPQEVKLINSCAYEVAVLTSPLEVRIRTTSAQPLVNERMSFNTYAILYVLDTQIGKDIMRGDGIIRDGGPVLQRAPTYTVIGPGATKKVPLTCSLDLPSGRSFAPALWSFEAPLGTAPVQDHGFDCSASVTRFNAEASAELRRRETVTPIFSQTLLPGRSPAK